MLRRMSHIVKIIADSTALISMALVLGIMFFTTVDVTGRFFDRPILGSFQISELILVWIICLAWPFTIGVRGHVRVELFISALSERTQDIIGIITHLLALGIFVLFFWQGIEMIKLTLELEELVSIIEIPLYPFQFAVPIGALLTCPVIVMQLIALIKKVRKR